MKIQVLELSEGGTLTVQGLKAKELPDGAWLMDVDIMAGVNNQKPSKSNYVYGEITKPASVWKILIEAIRSDREAEREHLIHHIAITNRIFALLWLEGKISKRTFSSIRDVGEYLIFSLKIEGKTREIRVYPEDKNPYYPYVYSTRDQGDQLV